MQKTYEAAVFDPEAFRTMLAQIKPEEAGLNAGGDEVLNRFQLSLLTEGSGTQVFSTTFVQWAAREALRRAQPLTMVARFAPRQREKQMNELLAEHQRPPELDPQGSLIDADMGAYYTWLNQQRLSGRREVGIPGVVRGSRRGGGNRAGARAGQALRQPGRPGRSDRADRMIRAPALLLAASPLSDDPVAAGLLALQRGDLAAAQTNLEAASKLAPRDGRVWVALSQTYWRQHKDADAEDAAGKAASFAPEDPAVLQSLAIYYSETQSDPEGRTGRSEVLRQGPGEGRGCASAPPSFISKPPSRCSTSRSSPRPRSILKEGAARVPKSAQLELALGVAYYGLRRFDDAADAFLRTIEIAPETEQPYTFLGKILDQIPSRLPQVTAALRGIRSGASRPAPRRICSTPKRWTRNRSSRRRRCVCWKNRSR